MTRSSDPLAGYRDRMLRAMYGRLTTVAHRVRRRCRSSFGDFDLTIEDLTQHGAVNAIECFRWMMERQPEHYLSMTEEELVACLTRHAARAMVWQIIDTYRKRDLRREKPLPEALLISVDTSTMDRVTLWRRIEEHMAAMSGRQRAVVRGLWDGLDAEEIGAELLVTSNVVRKELAAVRRLAA